MKLLQKALTRLNGLHYRQEYLCLSADEMQPLDVFLSAKNKPRQNITRHHCFVGYAPLIIAVPVATDAYAENNIRFYFSAASSSLPSNEISGQKDAVASLWLRKFHECAAGDEKILFYEGEKGRHRLVNPFHQFVIQLNNRLFHKRQGNVFLAGNLYKQVQIAYAVPRNISLITVGKNGLFNLFPTDLHGPAGTGHYIISLRHEGKACRQVMDTGKLLLSQVDASSYKTAYSLGKNHMQPLKKASHFPFSEDVAELFRFPIPSSAISYRELELQDSFIKGIHRIMLFKVLNRRQLSENGIPLAHIHNTYASWRFKKGLPGNYLLR